MEIFTSNGPILSLILMMAAVVFFLRWSQRNLKASAQRIKNIERPTKEQLSPSHNLDAPAEMTRWEVQMHDLTRDLTGQLDSKIAILQQLIRTAEERIVRLEKAVEQAQQAGVRIDEELAELRSNSAAPTKLSAERPPAPITTDPVKEEIYALADEGYASSTIATRTGNPVGEVEFVLSLREKG